MKNLIFIILVLGTTVSFAQDPLKDNFTFEGYILSEDSVPVENAFLINFRTSKIVATNDLGFFRLSLNENDSLMINHLSQTSMVIYAKNLNKAGNKIYVSNRTYILKPVQTSTKTEEQRYIDDNMKRIKEQADEPRLEDIKSQSGNVNPYNTEEDNPGATILKITNKSKKKETEKP